MINCWGKVSVFSHFLTLATEISLLLYPVLWAEGGWMKGVTQGRRKKKECERGGTRENIEKAWFGMQCMIVDVTASFSPLAFSDVRSSAATGFLSPTPRVMNTVFTQNQVKNQYFLTWKNSLPSMMKCVSCATIYVAKTCCTMTLKATSTFNGGETASLALFPVKMRIKLLLLHFGFCTD